MTLTTKENGGYMTEETASMGPDCTCSRPRPIVGPATCPQCQGATAELRGMGGLRVVCPTCEPLWLSSLPHEPACPWRVSTSSPATSSAMDFRTAHDVTVDLDSLTPAERAELVDAAVARLVDDGLELEPALDRAELGRAARGWVETLDRPALARLCGIVAARPRYDLRPVAGIIVTIVQARLAGDLEQLAGDLELHAREKGENSMKEEELPSPTHCRCGAPMRGSTCTDDPTPPRCGRCNHALSHGWCPLCEPGRWALAVVPRPEDNGGST